MPRYLDIEKLAKLVKSKRERKGLRETAKIIGLSASTISRVENHKIPDIETFLALCDWLEVDPGDLIENTENTSEFNNCNSICAMLRSDEKLNPEVAHALAVIVESSYSKEL